MKTIAHRGTWSQPGHQNTLPSLFDALSAGFSLETDIRLFQGEVVLSHDPVKPGQNPPLLKELLQLADRTPSASSLKLFLNVKEDGLLPYLQSLSAWDNKSVVFFDMSVPELVRYCRMVPAENLATRWSDVEEIPVLYNQCDWLWIDCFEKELTLSKRESRRLLQEKMVAFVSPELHGRNPDAFLKELLNLEAELHREIHLCRDVNPITL